MKLDFSQCDSGKRMPLVVGLSFALLLLLPGQVIAQQEEAADPAAEELEELRPLIDLGSFRIKDLRPTRNETLKLNFHMHLALNQSVGEQTLERLEYWKHRLRNQVLIAIRLSERPDFLDSDLKRFRRIVKLRVNRLLKMSLVDEALLTEFTMTTN